MCFEAEKSESKSGSKEKSGKSGSKEKSEKSKSGSKESKEKTDKDKIQGTIMFYCESLVNA